MKYFQIGLWGIAACVGVVASAAAQASPSMLSSTSASPAAKLTKTAATTDVSASAPTIAMDVEQAASRRLGSDEATLPATALDLDSATSAIAPVSTAASLPVVELVEPGTGTPWLPAQSAAALDPDGIELAQATDNRQATSGWYVALAPEVVFGYDIDTDGGEVTVPIAPAPGLPPFTTITVPLEASIDTDTGFGVSGAVGYRFDQTRVELEIGYNSNSVDRIKVNDVSTNVDGSIDNWRFLVNGYYDFPTNSRFSPYIGGGAGLAIVSANDVSATVPTLGAISIDDTNSSFVFQFKAGANYAITDTLNAFLGYRLMGIPGQSFEVLGRDLDADTLFIHSLQLGARYEF